MSFRQKLVGELEAYALSFLYFAACFLFFIALKKLILADYQIGFYGVSAALVGALIVAKVVLVLEMVPLGGWVEKRPAFVDVLIRTVLYSIGVFIAVIAERGFEQRHEHGGFTDAVVALMTQRDMYRIWATTIAVGSTILGFNIYSAFSMRYGNAALIRLLFKTPLEELTAVKYHPVADPRLTNVVKP
jgi:hypothetical protein